MEMINEFIFDAIAVALWVLVGILSAIFAFGLYLFIMMTINKEDKIETYIEED